MEEIDLILEDTKERMDKSIQFLITELKKILVFANAAMSLQYLGGVQKDVSETGELSFRWPSPKQT